MSFVKKINTAPQLYKQQKGVRPYANQQYCVSSGNPSLDALIGGGLPIGSIVLLIEDSYSHYYSHFLKTYLGEGIVNEHKLLILDADQFRERDWWMKFLPGVIKMKDPNGTSSSTSQSPSASSSQQEESKQEQLKVAWRYNTLLEKNAQDSSQTSQISYKFDNSKEMGNTYSNSMSSQLKKDEMTVFMKYDSTQTNYIDLWEQICEQVQNHLSSEEDDRIFRFLLPNFNLLLNKSSGFEENKRDILKEEKDMIRLLRNLKALMRATNGVCLIQVDEDQLSKHINSNLFFLADIVIKLTSFKDHQEMKIGEYDGTLRLLKQPKLHGLISSLSEFDVYALKLKGKQSITVEKIHLEPEDDRTGQDENLQQKGGKKSNKSAGVASVQCNPTKSHQLDF